MYYIFFHLFCFSTIVVFLLQLKGCNNFIFSHPFDFFVIVVFMLQLKGYINFVFCHPFHFCHCIHVVVIRMQQLLMASTSGIHFNTIMYEEYCKFVSKLKALFKNHKKKKNKILKVMHFGHSYSTNSNQPKHMVSLASHCKLLGWVFFCQ